MVVWRRTLASVALLAVVSPAAATDINSGEADGVYNSRFCPRLETQLTNARFDYKCRASNGTAENVERAARDPMAIGFGQLDVFALEVAKYGGAGAFTRLRVDDARECVFAVTRNREITNYGEVAVFASRLRFVLPPASSGSAATFRYLQKIDPTGVGAAKIVINAPSTEEALRMALSADDTVALFVQVPDPATPRFKLIQELGGHVVPVLDRNILRQQIEDRKIYFAQETEVTNARWLKSGTKVVTACTPLVVFTGSNDRVSGDKAKQDHKDLIATVVTMSQKDFLPVEPLFQRLLKRTRELSGASAERLVKLSEDAREKSKPWVEKAKDATGKAIEQAKPALEKAREAGRKALDKATEEARELIEKATGKDLPDATKR
jgi:hypothetical protein